MKSIRRVVGVLLIVLLAFGLSPRAARSDNGESGSLLEARLGEESGPVGLVESPGCVRINGRPAASHHLLWGGNSVQACSPMGADLKIHRVGAVRLAEGATARVATRTVLDRNGSQRRLLVLRVIEGQMLVELNDEATAYIESGTFTFTASKGSRFRAIARAGLPLINVFAGEVKREPQAGQQQYIIRPVGVGSSFSVRARSTRQIQIQVTDENDDPVPDLPILFALGGRGIGTLGSGAAAAETATVNTNAQGLANVEFAAGDTAGSDTISATIEGTRISWIAQVSVVKAAGFWSTRNVLLILGAAAGAGVITYFAVREDDVEPIRPVSPPRVEP